MDAMIELDKGWNPFTKYLTPAESVNGYLLNHYPHAAWYARTAIYEVTGKIESAKLLNFTIAYSSFFICAAALFRVERLSWIMVTALALLFALNPIVIYESMSYYIDGQVASLILILVSIFIIFLQTQRRMLLIVLCICVIYFINLKFTCVVFTAVFGFSALAWVWIQHQHIIRPFLLTCIVAVFAGIGFAGYPTYVKNTMLHQHPFYPLMGPGNIGRQVQEVPYPADFFGKNRFEKLNLATFSKPVWARAPDNSHPKALFFDFGILYLGIYTNVTAELSGLGPVFAEILLLTFVSFCLFLPFLFKLKSVKQIMMLCIVLLLSVFVIPECWYARYVPQLYFVPLLIIMVMTKADINPAPLLVTLLIMNVGVISIYYFRTQYHLSRKMQIELNELRSSSEIKSIEVRPGRMKSQLLRLDEAGIKYVINDSLKAGDGSKDLFGFKNEGIYK